jgi:hypothetical protein
MTLMGARPMARLIQTAIKTPLADEVLFGKLKRGGVVRVTVREEDGKRVLGFAYPEGPVQGAAEGGGASSDAGDDQVLGARPSSSSNGDLGSIVLFGAFLAYAVIGAHLGQAARRRRAASSAAVAWGEHDDGLAIVLGHRGFTYWRSSTACMPC